MLRHYERTVYELKSKKSDVVKDNRPTEEKLEMDNDTKFERGIL